MIALVFAFATGSDDVSVLGLKLKGEAITFGVPTIIVCLLLWRCILIWNLTYLISRASDEELSQFGDFAISTPILECMRFKETPALVGIVTTIVQVIYELIGPVIMVVVLTERGPRWWMYFTAALILILHSIAYKMLRDNVFEKICGESSVPD